MIWLPYCDGGSFSGNVDHPVIVGNTKLYFRGQQILNLTLTTLRTLIPRPDNIIVTGTSAGGLATYIHLDRFAEAFSLKPKEIVGLADGGYFLKFKDPNNNYWMDQQYTYVVNMQNISINCQKSAGQISSECFYSENNYPKIKTPLFIVNSLYDSWQPGNIVAPPDDGVNWNDCLQKNFPTNCSAFQMQTFNSFQEAMIASFQAKNVPGNRNGLFATSCYIHAVAIHDAAWAKVSVGGVLLRDAFFDWFVGEPKSHNHVDCPTVLCNPSCKNL